MEEVIKVECLEVNYTCFKWKDILKTIYLLSMLAALSGLCEGFSLAAASWGYSRVAGPRLLIVVASAVAEQKLENTQASVLAAPGLSSCGSRALEHRLHSCSAQV